jgi:hypothetical protein
VGCGGEGSDLTARLSRLPFSTGAVNKGPARWYVLSALKCAKDENKFSPVVLTTGPEVILCSGRVGSRAPSTRGALPLLGPAAGSVGSLRRMSQRRVFRCETGKLTLQPARWSAHNSTEVLDRTSN